MASKVLVAYATKYGSTREVAEAVAARLLRHGLEAELRPAREVRSLADYGAVVLGAPLYMLRWHKDAHGLLSRLRQELAARPVAVFALGPWNDVEGEWQEVRAQLDKALARHPWLRPVSVEVVGGRFDPARLSFPWNLVPALRRMPPSDVRDWDAIGDWAGELARQFQPAPAEEVPA